MFKKPTHKTHYYSDMEPTLDIKEYFNGPIQSWGLIQNWRGRVITRFDIAMLGTWNGNKGRLEENFTYYDGRKQQRIWHLTKNDDGTYNGTASDIIGNARSHMAGCTANWSYVMDIEVGTTIYRLTLDDWMWYMNDGVLINRSYIKKFGVTVAELTAFMKKDVS